MLGYCDAKDCAKVIADASPVGLGVVLIQCDAKKKLSIIAFGIKSLTDVENGTVRLKRGCVLVVELVTDHKPMDAIFGTNSNSCTRIEF